MPAAWAPRVNSASSDVSPDLCSSALEQPDMPAAEDCAHWLLAAPTVGGIFFQLSKRAGLKQPVTAEAGISCTSFLGTPGISHS